MRGNGEKGGMGGKRREGEGAKREEGRKKVGRVEGRENIARGPLRP